MTALLIVVTETRLKDPMYWAKIKVVQNILPINIPLFVSNTQVHLIDMVVGSPGTMISVSGKEDRGYPDVDEGPGVDTVQDFLYKLGMKQIIRWG